MALFNFALWDLCRGGVFAEITGSIRAAAGVPLAQIFRAATYNNARTLALDKLGAVKTGYHADPLILSSEPLQDVAAYKAIDMVIRQGQIYPRQLLSAAQP